MEWLDTSRFARGGFAICIAAIVVTVVPSPHARAERPAPAKPVPALQARVFDASDSWVCLIDAKRDVWCWQTPWFAGKRAPAAKRSEQFTRVTGVHDAVAVQVVHDLACALSADGQVTCWGCVPGQACFFEPVKIALERPARQIALGVSHACALLDTGEVWCWGDNVLRELGVNGIERSDQPRPVPGIRNATQLASQGSGACALLANGDVMCWGAYLLSTQESYLPRRIRGLGRATQIASTGFFTCAVVQPRSRVYCWGIRDSGQTSAEVRADLSVSANTPPERIGTLERVTKLALGSDFACALTDSGALYQWGEFSYAGVRHFGKAVQRDASFELRFQLRPVFRTQLEPRAKVRRNLAVTRVASELTVRDVIVGGYFTCLETTDAPLLCEPLLERMPFQTREVWPTVKFDAAAANSGGPDPR